MKLFIIRTKPKEGAVWLDWHGYGTELVYAVFSLNTAAIIKTLLRQFYPEHDNEIKLIEVDDEIIEQKMQKLGIYTDIYSEFIVATLPLRKSEYVILE